MLKRFFIVLAAALITAGCGGISSTDLTSDAPEENVTKVGSPTTVPTGDSELKNKSGKAIVEEYLAGNDAWKTNFAFDGAGLPQVVTVRFDVARGEAVFMPPQGETEVQMEFVIDEDGNLSGSSEAGYEIAASLSGSEKYPLDIFLNDNRLFAVDRAFGPLPDYFDSDADLLFDGEYFVAGMIRIDKTVMRDFCSADGSLLYEVAYDGEGLGDFGYFVKEVACDCQDGRCAGRPADKPLGVTARIIDMCKSYPMMCISLADKMQKLEDIYDTNIKDKIKKTGNINRLLEKPSRTNVLLLQ